LMIVFEGCFFDFLSRFNERYQGHNGLSSFLVDLSSTNVDCFDAF
jgi:hypothetical protein